MRPLPALALGTALGGLAWPLLQPPAAPTAIALAVVFGMCMLLDRASPLGLCMAGMLLGLLLPADAPGVAGPLRLDGPVRLRGTVVTAAQGAEADVHVSAWSIPGTEDWHAARQRVRVRFPEAPPGPGARVAVLGRAERFDLARLPGAPDPSLALATARVDTRVRASEAVRLGPPAYEPDLSGARNHGLLRAMLDGVRTGIPEPTAALLRRTGTWHVVSISGLHVGLCALVAWGAASAILRVLTLRMPGRAGSTIPGVARRAMCAAVAILAAWAYADLAGMPLPARRSVWMVVIASVLGALGRTAGRWEALALAWLGCTLAEPDAAHDVGAQLSFGALVGIFQCERLVLRWVPPDAPRLARWIASGLAGTLGATVGTLPVVALRFQDVPVLSPLANLVATPLIGAIATPALLASQVLPGAAGRAALLAADGAVDLALALLPAFDGPMVHPAVGAFGAACLAVAPFLRGPRLAMLVLAGLPLALRKAPKALVVTFLAVGQGDAALVEWPDGRTWLVDGGPGGTEVLHFLRRHGIRRLDALVVSHPHPDHISGLLAVARALPVAHVYAPRPPRTGEDAYLALLGAARAPRTYAVPRSSPMVRTGRATARLLHPPVDFLGADPRAVNDESLVLRVGFAGRSVLLPGDVESAGEAALIRGTPRADVLKIAHHGSRTSSGPAFLAAVAPEIAVISCGSPNPYGHPHPSVLRALRARGTRIYRTDTDGNVTVRLDSAGVHVSTSDAPARWRL
jgi:competence protein ComEC